jgi:hypothetical protein
MNLMNKDYRYSHLILDAQLFLVKNWMVLKNKPYYSDQALFTSFFQSVVKLLREEVSADNVILVWDKTPYHKVTLLEDYKGDRDYRGEGDITDDMTEEMKEELRKRTQQFESRQRVKYKLVYESYKFGMPSIVLGGYEADDFAFLASRSDLVWKSSYASIELDRIPEGTKYKKETLENQELVEIELDNGEMLMMTPDHLIETKRGWVPASDLTEDDELIWNQ